MDFVYGQVNQKAIKNQYWGGSTDTADVYIDEANSIIYVDAHFGEITEEAILDVISRYLNVSDSAIQNQFVTVVSETAGKISVQRRALVPGDIPSLPINKITNLEATLNNKTDTSVTAVLTGRVDIIQGNSAVQGSIDQKILSAIQALDSGQVTADVGYIINSIVENNGIVTATTRAITTNDIPNLAISKITDLSSQLTTLSTGVSTNAQNILGIENKIPSDASSVNKLADKAFVNSSIATATATFRGTFDTLEELMATEGTINDYAFYRHVVEQNTQFDRYKYTNGNPHWVYEYTLNNSSFTSTQWAAINSGITSNLVSQISLNTNNLAVHIANTSNPHNVTKTQIGLNNVDNTSDINKPISTATQTALNGKQATLYNSGINQNIKTINGQNILGTGDISISAGTYNYNNLFNRPQINSVELVGNKSLSDLGVQQISYNSTTETLVIN